MRKFKLFVLILIILFATPRCVEKQEKQEKNDVIIEEIKSDSTNQFTELTIENVVLYLKLFEVKHIDIVLAQSILETRYYKCSECSLDSNNIFGFRSSTGYYSYCHYVQSIADYKDWQKRKYDGQQNYYQFLKEVGYAEDLNYTNKLKYIVTQIQEYL